jgi:N6-adenosine-specific RNA methylase IME4/ParB-like chromosome segregation protein Spo0J
MTINTKAVRVTDIVVPPNRMRALRAEKVAEIAESIRARGRVLQPIVVRPRGRDTFWLVAGWHRLEAVRELGHETIPAVILDGLDADAALIIEIDENLMRAELSPAERAMHVGRRKELYEKLHPETKPTKAGGPGRAKALVANVGDDIAERFTKEAAKRTGKSERTIQREAERANKVTVLTDIVGTSLDEGDELDALAKLPEAEQRKLARRAKTGEKVTARHIAKKLRRDERERELADATRAAAESLGRKVYGVIYADPPWSFKVYNADSGLDSAADAHYPCMETEAIKALRVPAADNCVLFLWSTAPHLPEALDVMGAWGFGYRTHLIWKKDKTGLGYWLRNQHEVLLIGVRGDVPSPAPGDRFSSVVEAPRTAHSVKPDVIAEMIERMFPNMPRVELFARKARPTWDAWGNEVEAPLRRAAL